MKKRIVFITVLVFWSVISFSGGWIAYSRLGPVLDPKPSANPLLDEVWAYVRSSFVGTIPSDTVRNYGEIKGALATLDDRWTVFIEPQPRAIEREHLAGQFGGIGVNVHQGSDGSIIMSPLLDSPAQMAGIMEGDVLVGIDGVLLPAKPDLNNVASRVRGNIGTTVRITVLRQGKQLEFTIIRKAIVVPSVDWHIITGTSSISPTIGYIAIHQFTEHTGTEVQQALRQLREQHSQAYIVDLRDNGGGLLNTAVNVASEFLDSGTVLFERRRGQPDVSFPATKQPDGVYREPMAVLINGNTASAAEIVAGAIQDNQRGKLIGQKTFGKGSVQSIFDLSDGSSVHITSAEWLTPKKRTIDGVGLMPDIVVARPTVAGQNGQDTQLDRALAELHAALAQQVQ